MNTPIASHDDKSSSIPACRKWYFDSGVNSFPKRFRATPVPSPLSFGEIHKKNDRKVDPPSTSADGYNNCGLFTIPEGEGGKIFYGACALFPGGKGWGSLEVKASSEKVVAKADLEEGSRTAGSQGDHKYHTGVDSAQLHSGAYSWELTRSTSTTSRKAGTSLSATTALPYCRWNPAVKQINS